MGGKEAAVTMAAVEEEPRVLPFYGHRKSTGLAEFSNFFELQKPYEFVLPRFAQREGFPKSFECWFSEASIMAIKAALFGDKETFDKILKAQSPGQAKALGRQVQGFDENVWLKHLEETAYEVVLQKFRSDPRLATVLLKTGNAVIVEAAPGDRIWGVGLATSDPRVYDPEQWQGRNILGFALMKARDALKSPAVPTGEASEEAPAESKTRRWGSKKGEAATWPAKKQAEAALPWDCFAVLDFEATCENNVKLDPQEIIEFPLVLVDAQTLERVDEFRTYVRPERNPKLTQFCTELTGILQEQVDAAPVWTEALKQAQKWLRKRSYGRCLLVTCGDWDLRQMMPAQCKLHGEAVPADFLHWLNIKILFEQVTGKRKTGMAGMLTELEMTLDGRHHCGLDDCRNIARILQELLRRGGDIQEGMISTLKAKKAGYSSTPG